jgi:sugar phosphate isomerase/epimerase
MQISIASYSFNRLISAGVMDVFGYLESCRFRYHLDTADIWNGLMGKDAEVYLAAEFVGKVKAGLAERGMTLINYHVDGVHIWEDDAGVREKHYREALRHLEAAERMGARTVRIDAGGREREWTAEQFDEIVKRYREYAQRAADGGYRVGPEVHWGAEVVAENMERLARAVDHPGYGILLHAGRWPDADPDEGDRRVAKWVCHTHFDAKTIGTRVESALAILRDAGYSGCYAVEHAAKEQVYDEVGALVAELRAAVGRNAAGRSA